MHFLDGLDLELRHAPVTKIVEECPLYNFCIGLFSDLTMKLEERKDANLGFRRRNKRCRLQRYRNR